MVEGGSAIIRRSDSSVGRGQGDFAAQCGRLPVGANAVGKVRAGLVVDEPSASVAAFVRNDLFSLSEMIWKERLILLNRSSGNFGRIEFVRIWKPLLAAGGWRLSRENLMTWKR